MPYNRTYHYMLRASEGVTMGIQPDTIVEACKVVFVWIDETLRRRGEFIVTAPFNQDGSTGRPAGPYTRRGLASRGYVYIDQAEVVKVLLRAKNWHARGRSL